MRISSIKERKRVHFINLKFKILDEFCLNFLCIKLVNFIAGDDYAYFSLLLFCTLHSNTCTLNFGKHKTWVIQNAPKIPYFSFFLTVKTSCKIAHFLMENFVCVPFVSVILHRAVVTTPIQHPASIIPPPGQNKGQSVC